MILFIMTMAGNVCNYLFQLIMGRMLSVEDYGTMNALFSLMMIATVPAGTIGLVISRYLAGYNAVGEQNKIVSFLRKSMKYVGILTFAVMLLGILVSPLIKRYMNIDTISHVALMMVVIGISVLSPLITGSAQGLKKFLALGTLNFIGPLIKLAVGILLVAIGFRVNGAIGGLLMAVLVVILAGIPVLSKYLKPVAPNSDVMIDKREIMVYAMPVLITSLCMSVLTNIDMIMIKHYFNAQETGLYSSAVIFGRAIFYFPGAIVMAMFPIVAEAKAAKGDTVGTLKKSLLYTAVLCGISALVLSIFPQFVINLLFGARYLPAVPYIRLLAAVMLPLSLLSILVNYKLALNKPGTMIITLVVGCLTEFILITLFHNSILQVLLILLGVGISMLIANIVNVFVVHSKMAVTRIQPEQFL